MSLTLIRLLHEQRLDLLEDEEADTIPALDQLAWLTPHTHLLDAYTDLGMDVLRDKTIPRDTRHAALRRLVDLAFAAGYRASILDAHAGAHSRAARAGAAHLPGPLPQEPEEDDDRPPAAAPAPDEGQGDNP